MTANKLGFDLNVSAAAETELEAVQLVEDGKVKEDGQQQRVHSITVTHDTNNANASSKPDINSAVTKKLVHISAATGPIPKHVKDVLSRLPLKKRFYFEGEHDDRHDTAVQERQKVGTNACLGPQTPPIDEASPAAQKQEKAVHSSSSDFSCLSLQKKRKAVLSIASDSSCSSAGKKQKHKKDTVSEKSRMGTLKGSSDADSFSYSQKQKSIISGKSVMKLDSYKLETIENRLSYETMLVGESSGSSASQKKHHKDENIICNKGKARPTEESTDDYSYLLPDYIKNDPNFKDITDVKLVIEKQPQDSDTRPQQDRLSIPSAQIITMFLTETESQYLEPDPENDTPRPELNVKVFGPGSTEVDDLVLTRWQYGSNGFKYVLRSSWNKFKNKHNLKKQDFIQVISFRLERKLYLVIILKPETSVEIPVPRTTSVELTVPTGWGRKGRRTPRVPVEDLAHDK